METMNYDQLFDCYTKGNGQKQRSFLFFIHGII